RAERLAAERREKAAAELLRSWLRANGEDELVDAESGWGVRLQTAQGTPRYDVVSLREHDPALWQRCVELALVTLDHRAVQAQERAGQIAGLDRYRMPGSTVERLVVIEPRK
ncbi:MAG TPA: hypothetical protein VNM91_03815, partial [Dehalococcoidia bacterium]|nr:hypothetical protein [Dehalococcoidia bacterium]